MGAGNAKGLRKSASADDVDDRSVTSDGQWNEGRKHKNDSPAPQALNEHQRSKSFDLPASFNTSALQVVKEDEDQPKKEVKKGFFNFRSREKEGSKSEDDDNDSDSEAKESGGNRRFKIFGHRKKISKAQKDEKLDSDINDLEKTFDSLGIVGKDATKDGGGNKSSMRSKDDLEALEPMRNRMNVRISRPVRELNGVTTARDMYGRRGSDSTSGSNNGRKKFNYSWENDEENAAPVRQDEWIYQAVRIEGFDVSKFKQVNMQGAMEMNMKGSISAPVSGSGAYSARPPSSPLYDADDHNILQSIERALE
ncbi:uncharacterized protein LOC108665578 [Hyalella azteca]|uniref:Uncharacterized protein LOC108665578 n=1 Tax=Hyalella azteca TaxID=294128 RepID=A0A8B7N3M7_HYAAZ|nr:uncharacterized protein LOC108665578 [Hyalella azteca]